MIRSLLIANRGEIACRIARTARAMGCRTIAVYSDADASAMHVENCDLAVRIGSPAATSSYLCADHIIEAAHATGAEAIHPGYGFLSENANFAKACEKAGIVFVGPPAAAIEAMGSKAEAKALMENAGVPLVPGYHGADQNLDRLAFEADRIGYPILLKASAGGGGRGMRVVEKRNYLATAIEAAKRESVATFGDDRLLIEKYLRRPRHVEVQIFADSHGNTIHLFERDCSVQRRHQKVLEEAPAPNLDEQMRTTLGSKAVSAARAVDYVGAGTVEFMLDASGFYFIEMNTRLQVEHPITELITGTDLVEWQIRVADGGKLPLSQNQVRVDGHAMEVRLYAEDPVNFRPQTGRISHLLFPSKPARVDTGIRVGDTVSVHYDPLIAKLITHGRDRAEALERLVAALKSTEVAGLVTNQPFLARLVGHPTFATGLIHTEFIEEHAATLIPELGPASVEALALAVLSVLSVLKTQIQDTAVTSEDPYSPWHDASGWRMNEPARRHVVLGEAETVHNFDIIRRPGGLRMHTGRHKAMITDVVCGPDSISAKIDGVPIAARFATDGQEFTFFLPEGPRTFVWIDPLAATNINVDHGNRLNAPMPGKIVSVHVSNGQNVRRGQALMVLEAMKMEHTIAAPADGLVRKVNYAPGELVEEGVDLLDFEPADGA